MHLVQPSIDGGQSRLGNFQRIGRGNSGLLFMCAQEMSFEGKRSVTWASLKGQRAVDPCTFHGVLGRTWNLLLRVPGRHRTEQAFNADGFGQVRRAK